MHTWPAFLNFPPAAKSAVFSGSTSSKTMTG